MRSGSSFDESFARTVPSIASHRPRSALTRKETRVTPSEWAEYTSGAAVSGFGVARPASSHAMYRSSRPDIPAFGPDAPVVVLIERPHTANATRQPKVVRRRKVGVPAVDGDEHIIAAAIAAEWKTGYNDHTERSRSRDRPVSARLIGAANRMRPGSASELARLSRTYRPTAVDGTAPSSGLASTMPAAASVMPQPPPSARAPSVAASSAADFDDSHPTAAADTSAGDAHRSTRSDVLRIRKALQQNAEFLAGGHFKTLTFRHKILRSNDDGADDAASDSARRSSGEMKTADDPNAASVNADISAVPATAAAIEPPPKAASRPQSAASTRSVSFAPPPPFATSAPIAVATTAPTASAPALFQFDSAELRRWAAARPSSAAAASGKDRNKPVAAAGPVPVPPSNFAAAPAPPAGRIDSKHAAPPAPATVRPASATPFSGLVVSIPTALPARAAAGSQPQSAEPSPLSQTNTASSAAPTPKPPAPAVVMPQPEAGYFATAKPSWEEPETPIHAAPPPAANARRPVVAVRYSTTSLAMNGPDTIAEALAIQRSHAAERARKAVQRRILMSTANVMPESSAAAAVTHKPKHRASSRTDKMKFSVRGHKTIPAADPFEAQLYARPTEVMRQQNYNDAPYNRDIFNSLRFDPEEALLFTNMWTPASLLTKPSAISIRPKSALATTTRSSTPTPN